MGTKSKFTFLHFVIIQILLVSAQLQYFHTNLQFNVFGNYSGFHIKEVWGVGMALQNFDLRPLKVSKALQPLPLKRCRETCFVQKSCRIVTWNSVGQVCKLGSASSINGANITFESPGVWLFYRQGSISKFMPAVDGIFYWRTATNGTFNAAISVLCNSTLRRLAYPNSDYHLTSIIEYSYTAGTTPLRINLIGLSDGVTLQWGDVSQFSLSSSTFPIFWDPLILVPTFVILNGVATAVESTDVYYGLCMDNNVFMLQPWT